MKKIKDLYLSFEERMGLYSKTERRWFRAALVLLFVYMECFALAQFTTLMSLPLCVVGLLLVSRIKDIEICHVDEMSWGKRLRFIAIVAGITFAVFFLWQIAYWPGGFSPDSIDQYNQAITGRYLDWHPTLHTWLFFRLPLFLFHGSAAAIITVQLIYFSLAIAYMFYVLYTSGCPQKFLIFAWLYIVLNPNNTNLMLYPWKDCAMTIFSVVLISYIVRIYLTKGAWLKKWYHFILFTVFAFLVCEMRKNAILFVVPIFIILFFFIHDIRFGMVISAICVILASLMLHGPVFSYMRVQEPDMSPEEVLGLPLTILSTVYAEDPESLSDEARNFMSSLATPEQWEDYVPQTSYLGIKYSNKDHAELVRQEGVERIVRYALEAAISSPQHAWRAFINLTRMVYGFDYEAGWGMNTVGVSGNSYGLTTTGNFILRKICHLYSLICCITILKYFFRCTGTLILLMLFLAVGRLGKGNLSRVMLVLAPMTYNFGTMLMLCGDDYRYFHFNYLIVIPIVYLILRDRDQVASENVEGISV